MACQQWTYHEPGSEADQCGVSVRYGEVFECNACLLATSDARIEELEAECEALRERLLEQILMNRYRVIYTHNNQFIEDRKNVFIKRLDWNGNPKDILRAVMEVREW